MCFALLILQSKLFTEIISDILNQPLQYACRFLLANLVSYEVPHMGSHDVAFF